MDKAKAEQLLELSLSVLLKIGREETVPMDEVWDAGLDIGEFLSGHDPENN